MTKSKETKNTFKHREQTNG